MQTNRAKEWTMQAFLLAVFGPRQIEPMVRLAQAARERAEFLRDVPDGAQVRHELIQVLRELVSRAERKLLHTEADLAGSLLATVRLNDETSAGCDRLMRGALILEEMLARRLAKMQMLARQDMSQALVA